MPPSYSIHLFGKPSVSTDAGEAVAGLSLGKPLALLSYLLVEGKTSRDEIIGLLWGDVPESKARNAFRQALHRLRTALGEEAIPHDPDQLFVAEEIAASTDVARFERLLAAGQPEMAIEQYAGDFLSGLDVGESAFDEWREASRKKYSARFRDALRAVIQADIDAGDVNKALRRAATLTASDAGDVDAAILYSSTLLGAGRRAEALQALEQFERRFQQDFETAAPAPVRDLLSRLRRARNDDRTAPEVRRTRFAGREAELSILLTRLRELESAGGTVVVIDGEAGTGKTRLIEEFFARARDLGGTLLLQGRERLPEAGIPFASVAEALRGVLDAPGIAGTGQHLLAEAARLLPQLRDQFSLPSIAEISDDAGRVRFYEGIAALLDSVSYEQPVCMVLDDFHNCSAATYGLVEYLAERLRAAPILFVVVGRSTRNFAALRDQLIAAVGGAGTPRGRTPAHIEVGPLDERAALTLVEDLCEGTDENFSRDNVLESSGRIPFRIIEACERIRAGAPEENTPVLLRDVLWSRLQRSTQAEQRLFVTVALFDRPVSLRLLAAASHLPEKSALDAALSLERDGLLRQQKDGVAPAHDFSGELALEGTGPAGRALLAGWAADALERDGSGSSAELARLFGLAGRRKEAYRYSRNAAFEAMANGARDEAKIHLDAALNAASNRDERADIESLLRTAGAGLLMLSGQTSPESQQTLKTAAPTFEAAGRERAQEDAGTKSGPTAKQLITRRAIRPGLLTAIALALLALLVIRTASSFRAASAPGTSLADTLLVARELDPRDTVIAFATGPLGSSLQTLPGATRHGPTRSWIDSLRLPWANPLPSPDGRSVAVERITKNGSELYIISMDRRDTLQLRSGAGDDFSSGWSPDGKWLLATHAETRSDGSYGAELFAYSIFPGGPRIAFDTSRSSAVVEAVWSPDGSHVAWSARVGPQHQQEIFVSDADGNNVVDLTNNAAEDYSIAWSPDGQTIAFTSERSGRAELYSEEINTHVLRRLTWEGAHADHAEFSPDGRWLAYESTRGGNPAVYVMPSGGGTGRSVASAMERVSLVGWRGNGVPYIDQIFADIPPLSEPGDSGALVIRAFDRRGHPMKVRGARLSVLDPNLLRISDAPRSDTSDTITIHALARGLARVTVSAGSWRADTAFVPIGEETLGLVEENFETPLRPSTWRVLGDPPPTVGAHVGSSGSGGLIARSDRQWLSGLLSRTVFPIRSGLSTGVWVRAPFTEPAAARTFVVALVAADPAEVVDSVAPHFLRLAAVSWLGEAGRISYAVGRETFTEPLAVLGGGDSHRIAMTVGDDATVAFFIDGRLRWKSTLRLLTAGDNSRAELWLASQATDNSVVFDDVSVRLQPRSAGQ